MLLEYLVQSPSIGRGKASAVSLSACTPCLYRNTTQEQGKARFFQGKDAEGARFTARRWREQAHVSGGLRHLKWHVREMGTVKGRDKD
jgi:hypothetical protein